MKCLRIKDQINTWTDREVHHGAVKVRWACSRQEDDSLTRSVFSYSLSHSWFPVSIWSSLSAAVFYKYGRLRPLVHSCFCFARVLVLRPVFIFIFSFIASSPCLSQKSCHQPTPALGLDHELPVESEHQRLYHQYNTHFLYFILSSLLIEIFHWLLTDSVINLE